MNRKVESEKDWGKENVRGYEKRAFFFKKIKKKKAVFRHLIGNDCSYGNEQQPNDTKPIFCCDWNAIARQLAKPRAERKREGVAR